jgi:hypothetical protein
MRIKEKRFLRGPNLYAASPCLLAVIDTNTRQSAPEVPGFAAHLLALLPGLPPEASASAPGDRRDADLIDIGRTCAAGFDELVVYENENQDSPRPAATGTGRAPRDTVRTGAVRERRRAGVRLRLLAVGADRGNPSGVAGGGRAHRSGSNPGLTPKTGVRPQLFKNRGQTTVWPRNSENF